MAGADAAGTAGAWECAAHDAHTREVSWGARWGNTGQA
jgi:hypothetical protein